MILFAFVDLLWATSAEKSETMFSQLNYLLSQCQVTPPLLAISLWSCSTPWPLEAPLWYSRCPLTLRAISFASADQGTDRPETCRAAPPIYGSNGELLSPRLVALGGRMGLGMEGELVSPLLMAPVHIDPSCLHPDLLTEVQHVVIAREQLLLHLNQVIGRGQS